MTAERRLDVSQRSSLNIYDQNPENELADAV